EIWRRYTARANARLTIVIGACNVSTLRNVIANILIACAPDAGPQFQFINMPDILHEVLSAQSPGDRCGREQGIPVVATEPRRAISPNTQTGDVLVCIADIGAGKQ